MDKETVEYKKALEAYLHLYIGQDVLILAADYRLVHTKYLNKGDVVRLTCELLFELAKSKFARIQLVLRPLSSMTQEEFLEVRGINGWPNHHTTFEGADGTHINYRYGKSSTVKGYKSCIDIERTKPAVFNYLLSRGFDLFSLIGSLAIDKADSSSVHLQQ